MSVRRRANLIGQQRVDVPHLKSIESAVSNDFDELINGLVIGEDQSYVVRGLTINIPGSIGSSANGLQLLVEDSAFLHGGSDESGTFFTIPSGTAAEVLSSTTNTRVEGAFTPNTDNYIGIEFVRAVDDATSDQVYFWNPTTNVEITKTVPLGIILDYKIVISTSSFASNVMPISIVETDASNNVISITDRRPLLYRLGTAGDANPDPFYSYPWADGRTENFYTSTNSTSDPFLGGDKQITNMKDFFDALMTEFKVLKGTPFWYSESAGSITRIRQDASNTAFTGKGNIIHGAMDFQGQVAGMTTDVIIKTSIFSAPPGISITGDGSTDIDALISTYNAANPDDTIYLFSGDGSQIIDNGVSIDLTSKAGQLNWDADMHLNFIGGRLRHTVKENTESQDITLANNEVAYLNLVRGVSIVPNLIFTQSGTTVTSVASVPWTSDLVVGDFIKDSSKGDANYYEIASIIDLSQVTLTTPFLEISSGPAGFDADYSYGVYETNASPAGNDRYVQIADRSLVPFNEDAFWLFYRQDDTGSIAKTYARMIGGQELEQGEAQNISDNTSLDTLNFIGAASETDNSPDYVNAVIASVAQVTTYTSDLAANFTSGQYFRINSAGDEEEFYVWVNKDAAGGDPTPAGLIGVEVAVTTGESAVTTAGSISSALDALQAFNSVDNLDGTFTVTNSKLGITTDSVNIDMGGSFSLVVDTQGVGEANHFIIDGENLVRSIKRLDKAAYEASTGLSKLSRQNINSKLINGGTWHWDLLTTTLTNSALAQIQIPGLNDTRNEIAIQSIVLANDNDVAYVERNLDIGVDAVLTVNVAQIHTMVMTDNTYIIARREGNNVVVGENLFKDGEYLELDSALSEINRHHSQLIAKPSNPLSDRVKINGSDILQLSGSKLSLEQRSLLLDFDGAVIDFTTGEVFETDGITPLLAGASDFTPAVIAANEYFYYSISVIPNITNADNTITGQILVTPATGSDAVLADAPKAPFPSSGLSIGLVYVQEDGAAGILNIGYENITLLSAAGGGSGSGLTKASLHDPLSTTLPTGASVIVDGVTGVDGDLVLFTNLTANNNKIYKLSGVGVAIAWEASLDFNLGTPEDGDAVIIKGGASFREAIGLFDGNNWKFNDTVRYYDGIDYWEQSSLKTADIVASTTDDIFSIALIGSENIVVDYSILRGSISETGTVIISSNGTIVDFTRTSANVGVPGVDLFVDILATDLRFRYTADAGSNGTIKYSVKRWSHGVGGPGGLASYSGSVATPIPAAGVISDIQYHGASGNLYGDTNFQWNDTDKELGLGDLSISAMDSSALVIADNQTTAANLLTLDAAASKFFVIEYSIERNGESRIGRLQVCHNGTLSILLQDSGDTGGVGISDLEIVFSSQLVGSDLFIKYTSTNTGFAGTFKFSMRKWN